jgi:hypothetical protein
MKLDIKVNRGDRRKKSKYQRTDGEHEKRLNRMEVKYPSS